MANKTKRAITPIVAEAALKDGYGKEINVDNPKVEGNAEFGSDVTVDGKLKLNSVDDIEISTGSGVNQFPIKSRTDTDITISDITRAQKKGIELRRGNNYLQFLVNPFSSYGSYAYLDFALYKGRYQILPNFNATEVSVVYLLTLPLHSGTFALTSDIPTYYKHFITLTGDTGKMFTLNVTTKDNTVIDSLTDLFTTLGNTDIAGYGTNGTDTYFAVHVGTSSDETTFTKADGTTASLTEAGYTAVADSVTTVS